MTENQTDAVEPEARFDVVIYDKATRTVDTIIGRTMRLNEGHFNAVRRRDTGLERVNDAYSVAIVDAGTNKEGQRLTNVVEW